MLTNYIINMNVVVFILNILIVVVVSGGPAWKEVQRGGGLKIGSGSGKNLTASRGNGIKIGGSTRGSRITTTTTMLPEEDHINPPTISTSEPGITHLHVGMAVPYKSFGVREYNKAISNAKYTVHRKLKMFKHYDIKVHIVMKELTPTPTGTT